jgi:hypothetical protein
MANVKLTNIIKGTLNEITAEPSDQLLKSAMQIFRQETRIQAPHPVLAGNKQDVLYYVSNLNNEVKSHLFRKLFKSVSLQVEVRSIPRVIGAYTFEFVIRYSTEKGKYETKSLGLIKYENNDFKSELI